MKSIILISILIISFQSFSQEKCLTEQESKPSESLNLPQYDPSYPIYKLKETGLIPIRITHLSLEFDYNKKPHQAVCYEWPPEVKKNGHKDLCKFWCILPREDESPRLVEDEISSASKKCKTCASDAKTCKDIELLNKKNKTFKLKSSEGIENLIEIDSSGKLFVFQTNNGSKDLSKPYYSITRESEYYILKPQEINRKEFPEGYTKLVKLSVSSNEKTIDLESEYRLMQGTMPPKRLCNVIELDLNDCKRPKALNHLWRNSYNCFDVAPGGATPKDSNFRAQ